MRAVLDILVRRAWILLAWLSLAAAHAAAPPTVIVVDSSNSMSAPLNGEVRLDTARSVLGQLLAAWQPDAPLGLIAYGHRKTGDCNDIEVLQPIGPVDAPALTARLTKLRARGKTPLASSIEKAASLLAEKGQGGSIILVTDGVETCRADPCAVAKALRDADAGLTIHVVGFAVEKKDEEQLACIATAGGGSYRTAADAAELTAGIGEAAGAAVEPLPAQERPPVSTPPTPLPIEPPPPPTPPAPPAPPPPPAPKQHQVTFEAVIAGDGPLVDHPVTWHIVGRDGTDFAYDGASRGLSLELFPGQYAADIKASNAAASQAFEVTAAPDQTIQIPLPAGRLASRVVPYKGADPMQGAVTWRLEPLTGQPHADEPHTANPTWLLAEGQYRLTATSGAHSGTAEFTVATGKPQEIEISLALGKLSLSVATAPDADPLTAWQGLAWHVKADDGTEVASISSVAAPTVEIAAGAYRVDLDIAGTTISQPVEVVEGETRAERLIVPTAKRTLVAALGPDAEPFTDWRDSAWTVIPLDAIGLEPGKPLVEGSPVANPQYDLMPGRWSVAVKSGFAAASTEITVGPGTSETIRLNLAAGRVRLAADPAPGAPAPLNIVFELLPLAPDSTQGDPLSLGGSSREISGIVPAGRYRAVATDELGRTATREFDLAVGADQEIMLTLN